MRNIDDLGPSPAAGAPETTGRFLVLLDDQRPDEGVRALSASAGLRVASTLDWEGGAPRGEELSGADALVFDQLGVAVVDSPPDRVRALSVGGSSGVLAIEPERVVHAQAGPPLSPAPPREIPAEYLRGWRDGVESLVRSVLHENGAVLEAHSVPVTLDEAELTWGLQVTGVGASRFSGKGIRVAVLDTGIDLEHPDFVGRQVVARAFAGTETTDHHGHGTHTAGTACGPQRPERLPRYGVAYGAELYVGRVLDDKGDGSDRGVLAGINWALGEGCTVVNLSLGGAVPDGYGYSQVFEQVAQRALRAGAVLVAAAGNHSSRPSIVRPVAHPANCPSIVAVAAVDREMAVARFSNAGGTPQAGQVDIAGPGLDVRSAWPRPVLYQAMSGTSQAAPHVSGIAALLAEASPENRGRALVSLLLQSARRLPLSAVDVGAGLVQAP